MNKFFERRRQCINDVRQRLYVVDYNECMLGFTRGDFYDLPEAMMFAGPPPEDATDEEVHEALADDLRTSQRQRERGNYDVADYFEILARAAFDLPSPELSDRAMELAEKMERQLPNGETALNDSPSALRNAATFHARSAA